MALPDSKQIRSWVRLLDCAVAVPVLAVVVFYIWSLLGLDGREWVGLMISLGIYAVAAGAVEELIRRRLLGPLTVWRDARPAGRPSSQVCRLAFQSVITLPFSMMRVALGVWLLAIPVLPLLSWSTGSGIWGLGYRSAIMAVAACLGALVSGAFVFFGSKQLFAETRSALAADIPDPVERASLVPATSLSRKIQVVVLGSVVGVSMLMISLSHAYASRALDEIAVDWQGRVLLALQSRMMNAGFDEATAGVVPPPELAPYPAKFSIETPETVAQRWGDMGKRIVEAVAKGESAGRFFGGLTPDLAAWRKLPDGRVLLSVIPAAAAGRVYIDFHSVLLFVLLLAAGLSLSVASLMAADFRRAAEALCADAERMALGDLRPGHIWEAEDEMGGLARAFERMSGALRATVGRVAEAADRVDSAAGQIQSVTQSVAVASADQVRRIQQANELMIQIREQVAGVSGSAQALNISVEESSSSILELGAAGDELNDTASVLSSKVDEVSGSIEQMVRSVKQVSSTTEQLSGAAAETSSSMEEMASSMRVVDNTAELTADLSRGVVVVAESGQEKVSQTIEGMEAIRDATDAAERVIRGLGGRAKEIGGILDVIDDVADETNLLALNAAIIAAQAGEHGRAFSVVADEIKELADRVLASTKEIGELIRSVQQESENAIGAIEVGSASVASGVERSAEAGTALEEITRASRESGTRIGEIVTAVREQTKATVHVVSLMEAVREGVEQISVAGAEQDRGNEVVYLSVVTMREVAQQVRHTTEEQSRGFGRIRESVEGVRGAVENINSSLQDQTKACAQVATYLEQVFDGTRSNEEAAQQMGEAMRDLTAQAQALRNDVAKFRV